MKSLFQNIEITDQQKSRAMAANKSLKVVPRRASSMDCINRRMLLGSTLDELAKRGSVKFLNKILLIFIASIMVLVVYANLKVIKYQEFTKNEISQLPIEKTCLVLGTSKKNSSGEENLFYKYRIAAAKHVYAAGKCSKLVVSGDNRRNNYNEPDEMKKSLIEQGVPASNIYCDYAGGRTLDSVIRFKRIFGQTSGIVISQEFHNARAIYIARANGISLTGFNAQEVDAYNGFRTKLREILSRVRAVVDIEIFHSEPRHNGETIQL